MRTPFPSLVAVAAVVVAACGPTSPSGAPSATSAPDPLAIRYEVRVGQTALANVTGVAVTGPDLELIEVRIAGGGTQIAPRGMGPVRLEVRADWTEADRTIENWRQSLTQTSTENPLRPVAETVTVVITPSDGAPVASYAFQRCLPTEHEMRLGAQPERARQTWRMVCQAVTRS